MKKICMYLAFIVLLCSHDMYLKFDSYFLKPNTSVSVKLFNGTFQKSENVIDRDRMTDVSLVGNGVRTHVGEAQWREKDSVTILDFKTGEAGTWVAGLSTAPRVIDMSAEDFNGYLEHDGVVDMLACRRENDALGLDASEQYSKYVKAIFQVGDKTSDDWQTVLGYPLEFIPLSNPYSLNTGDELQVKLLSKGKPLVNQLVYANYVASKDGHSHTEPHSHDGGEIHTHQQDHDSIDETGHSHGEGAAPHQHTSGDQLRTDENGIITVKLAADGIWYLRTINLVHSEAPGLTHESNWSTLTFEVVHGHDESEHSHLDHEDDGIPSYVFWLGSFVVVFGLFFMFNRKKN
ncbi:DUF4198 domain-containing protein [Formosa sp. 4Alg 33]|uniref:DUF4198 domain-containing protein n=1 Tax=Formosa sp. 4Alg 33 TaxID=3382189 RepID=UPI003D9C046F